MAPEGKGVSLALIINTASYERVAFALSIATAAAALGRPVRVLFGHGGLLRLKRGATDQVGTETAAWLRRAVKMGLEKSSLSLISESLETLRKLGGEIYACPAAMAFHNLLRDELVDQVSEVRSVTEFIRQETNAGAHILYI